MKQMKKLLCGVLMFCMIVAGITIVPQNVQAATASGNDGEIHWEIKGDTLTLSAVKGTKGRMKSYSKKIMDNKTDWHLEVVAPPWLTSSATSKVKNVIIKNDVTELKSFSLYCNGREWSDMEKSKLPSLNKIVIAGNVKSIPEDFLLGDAKTIVLCEGIKNFDKEICFWGNYKDVYLPKTLSNIPYYSFGFPADSFICTVKNVYGYSNSSASKYVTKCNQMDEDYLYINNGTSNQKVKFVSLNKSSTLSKAKATSSISINKGKSQTIKVTLPTGFTKVSKYTCNPADVKVTYKSNNSKVATVSSSGKVTGKKKGTAKITITMQIKDGAKKTVTTKITVK